MEIIHLAESRRGVLFIVTTSIKPKPFTDYITLTDKFITMKLHPLTEEFTNKLTYDILNSLNIRYDLEVLIIISKLSGGYPLIVNELIRIGLEGPKNVKISLEGP